MNSEWDDRPASAALVTQARSVEAVEAAAWADSFEAVAGTDLGTAVARIGDATLLRMEKLPAAFFSKVIGLGMKRPARPEIIDEILAWYHDAGFNDIWFQPSPAAAPDGLLGLLESRGIRPIERRWGKFLRGAEAPPEAATDLEIREIGAGEAATFAQAAVEGFELPAFLGPWVGALPGRAGWRCYLALDGAEPAACAAMFTAHGAAFLGFDATRPAFRRRGRHPDPDLRDRRRGATRPFLAQHRKGRFPPALHPAKLLTGQIAAGLDRLTSGITVIRRSPRPASSNLRPS